MTVAEYLRYLRIALKIVPESLVAPIWLGLSLGCLLLFLATVFGPWLAEASGYVIELEIVPDWLWFGVGVAISLFVHILARRPLLPESVRVELDAIDRAVRLGELPDHERRHVFREAAWNLAKKVGVAATELDVKGEVNQQSTSQEDDDGELTD